MTDTNHWIHDGFNRNGCAIYRLGSQGKAIQYLNYYGKPAGFSVFISYEFVGNVINVADLP